MSNSESQGRAARADSRARRVMVCAAAGGAGAAFAARLAAAGYEVQSVGANSAAREIENFAPQAVVVEARGADGDSLPDFVRKLRADRRAARLPLVVVFGDARGRASDDSAEAARALARTLGADDCFALSTPAPEVLARLDALFWRVEAGRDLAASRSALEQRSEIEDFMRLIEDARASVGDGASGALALVAAAASDAGEATGDGGGSAGDADALRAAHEFFGRNLRRADSLAFYGPDQLLAYLPRATSDAAREDLARLHAEFSAAHPRARVAVGLARFPEDGTEIEGLIERAEVSLEDARADAQRSAARAGELTRETHAPRRAAHEDGGDGALDALEIGRTVIVADDASGGVKGSAEAASGLVAGETEFEGSETKAEEAGAVSPGAGAGGDGTRAAAASLESGGERISQEGGAQAVERVAPPREASASRRAQRALRESQRGESFETSVLPAQGAGAVLARAAADAAARERELRSRGARMPRRVLLAVSDPARMAQVNLLLRSASYEVRAAFDGGQTLDLLRIERADLLVLDLDLNRFDGVEVLRRLRERHREGLPLPVLLLHPRTEEGARACAAAHTLGARGFVALPYDPAEMLEAVRETGGGD